MNSENTNTELEQEPIDPELAELEDSLDDAEQVEENENAKKAGNIFDTLQEEISESDLPAAEKNKRLSRLLKASSRRVNIMLVGATGAGKSSTINALFDMSVATVGVGVDPETKDIERHDLNGNLTIWDSPGLGDGVDTDKLHITQIVKKLSETDENNELLIDLVLVVLDASSKDLAVSFDVINNTLIPCLGEENHRILIALNKCDMAKSGRYWNNKENTPEDSLVDFLIEKVNSVKRRIYDATGVEVEPVFFSAGYSDGEEKQSSYNLTKLLYYILQAVPAEKRLVLVDSLNKDEDNWECNDEDYMPSIKETFLEALVSNVTDGAERGGIIGGCSLGVPGIIAGALIGGVVGALKTLIVRPILILAKK